MSHLDSNPLHRAERRGVVRLTDGDESVESDEDGDPDRGELGDMNKGVHKQCDVRDEGVVALLHKENVRREDLRESGREKECVVKDGHRLKKKCGDVTVSIHTEYNKRETVSCQQKQFILTTLFYLCPEFRI